MAIIEEGFMDGLIAFARAGIKPREVVLSRLQYLQLAAATQQHDPGSPGRAVSLDVRPTVSAASPDGQRRQAVGLVQVGKYFVMQGPGGKVTVREAEE